MKSEATTLPLESQMFDLTGPHLVIFISKHPKAISSPLPLLAKFRSLNFEHRSLLPQIASLLCVRGEAVGLEKQLSQAPGRPLELFPQLGARLPQAPIDAVHLCCPVGGLTGGRQRADPGRRIRSGDHGKVLEGVG